VTYRTEGSHQFFIGSRYGDTIFSNWVYSQAGLIPSVLAFGFGQSPTPLARHLIKPSNFAYFSMVKCKILPNMKLFFIRINLGLSEAAVRSLAEGARREIEIARPEPACNHATTV